MSDTQQPVNPPVSPILWDPKSQEAFLIQEHDALRAEILKRMEIQHQLLSLALIALGTFLTIGFKDGGSPAVVSAYPILAMFLCLAWCIHDIYIREIGNYIREHIEVSLLGLGWEANLYELRKRTKRQSSLWARCNVEMMAGGIFVGTQILAVLLAMFQTGYSVLRKDTGIIFIIIIIIDLVVIAVTWLLFSRRKKFPL